MEKTKIEHYPQEELLELGRKEVSRRSKNWKTKKLVDVPEEEYFKAGKTVAIEQLKSKGFLPRKSKQPKEESYRKLVEDAEEVLARILLAAWKAGKITISD